MASGVPDTSPANRDYRPVHAEPGFRHDPGADAGRGIDQEGLAEELGHPQVRRSFLTSHAICMPATRMDRPIVSGTLIK
jgi:hypothetical protein